MNLKINRLKKITLISMFVGFAVGSGFALAFLPNVELMTFIIFTSGIVLGSLYGVLVGFLSFAIYSSLNPYGIAPFPLFLAQVLSGSLIGFAGGAIGKSLKNAKRRFARHFFSAVVGILLTLIYDILTNLAAYISMGNPSISLGVFVLAGISFAVVHIISNAFVFFFFSFIWGYLQE